MLETLLGGLLGGIFRLIPEVLKFFDRKNDRAHELAMMDKNLEEEKLRGANQLAVQQEVTYGKGLDALSAAVEAQGKLTGIKFVDGLSALVRPVVTYWFMGIYMMVKTTGIYMTAHTTGDWSTAINTAWTSDDMAIFAGILNFWFLSRVFDRNRVH